jgi:hypothetical protein
MCLATNTATHTGVAVLTGTVNNTATRTVVAVLLSDGTMAKSLQKPFSRRLSTVFARFPALWGR